MLRSRRSQGDGGGLPAPGIRRGGAGTEAAPSHGVSPIAARVSRTGDVRGSYVSSTHPSPRACEGAADIATRRAGTTTDSGCPAAGGDLAVERLTPACADPRGMKRFQRVVDTEVGITLGACEPVF